MTAITALWSTYQRRHGFRMASTNPLVRLLATEAAHTPDEQASGELASAYERLVMERWTSGEAAAIAPWALAAFYRVRRAIPRGAQLTLRRALIRRRGVPAFPSWPYDESVRDQIGRASCRERVEILVVA